MATLIRPKSVDFGMNPQLAASMQQLAQGAGDIPRALGGAIASPIRELGSAYQRAQSEQAEQQKRAMMMQAAQGDLSAQQELMAYDPQAAAQMQEMQIAQAVEQRAQQEADAKQEAQERKELGRYGNAISVEIGENKRKTVHQFYKRVLQAEGDPSMFGMDSPEAIDSMSVKDLNQVGKIAQSFATDAPKERELGMREEELGIKEGQLALKGEELELKKATKAEEKMRRDIEANKLPERAPPIKDPDKGRADFTNLSKEFIKVRDAYDRITVSAKDPSAAGDLAMIFNYMKMLDPGSTVREGEFATAQSAGGVGERVVAQYNKVLRGERLSDTQRDDFTNRSNKLFGAAKKNHLSMESQFTRLAEKSNIDPEGVVLDFLGDHRGEAIKTVTESRVLPDGRTMLRYSDGTLGIQ